MSATLVIDRTIYCRGCSHVLAKPQPDGQYQLRHRGLVVVFRQGTVVCPRCGQDRRLDGR